MAKNKKNKKKMDKEEASLGTTSVEQEIPDQEAKPLEKEVEEEPAETDLTEKTPKSSDMCERKNDFLLGLMLGVIIVSVCVLIVFLFELEYATSLEKRIANVEKNSGKLGEIDQLVPIVTSLESSQKQLKELSESGKLEIGKMQERLNSSENQFQNITTSINEKIAKLEEEINNWEKNNQAQLTSFNQNHQEALAQTLTALQKESESSLQSQWANFEKSHRESLERVWQQWQKDNQTELLELKKQLDALKTEVEEIKAQTKTE